MNLAETPFRLISLGQKVVEMRICNNGRENITSGDKIVFTNNQNGERLEVLVLSVSKYSSFEELYRNYDKRELGYKDEECADPDDMLIYYNNEDILRFGVLAIRIKLLNP